MVDGGGARLSPGWHASTQFVEEVLKEHDRLFLFPEHLSGDALVEESLLGNQVVSPTLRTSS
jgi:hypothetical protein